MEEVQTVSDAILLVHKGTIPATNEEIAEAFATLPESKQKQILPDSLHTLGTITTRGDTASLLDPIQSVIDKAHLPPGVTIEISGSDSFDEQMMNEMTKQIVVLILGAIILMFIGLFLLFGSVRYRLLPLLFCDGRPGVPLWDPGGTPDSYQYRGYWWISDPSWSRY